MRLTQEIRKQIIYEAGRKTFDTRMKALFAEEHKLAERAYNVAIPAHIRTAIEVIQNYDGIKAAYWFKQVIVTKYNVGGYTIALSHGKSVPAPYNHYESLFTFPITGRHEKIAQDIRDWSNRWETYKKERDMAERTLRVLMKQTTTTEGLFKLWPEGHKFYSAPPLTPVMKISVPAVQMDALNKALGLA